MRKILKIFLFLVIFFCIRCASAVFMAEQQMTMFQLRQSILNQTDVSLLLAKNLILTYARGTNLVFSPLSLHVLLGSIAAGSSGSTRDQFLSFLKSKSPKELHSLSSHMVTHVMADGRPLGGPRLSCSNGVWVEQSSRLKPSFQEIVKNAYKAFARNVDFRNKAAEVRQEVNTWAEKETKGLIKDILPPGSVDASTKLILANAMYFKGVWNEKFDSSATKDDEFFLLNGDSIQAPFMTSKKKQYVRAFDNFKVLGLPYKQGEDERQFSMYIFLPDAKDGLPALLEKVSSESGFIEDHLPYQRVRVGDFRIPKFKMAFGFEASEVLKGSGLELPFYGGLTEMVDSNVDFYVSGIFHKAFIEVNEEGTEAAAASAAVIKCVSVESEVELDFVADHPFLFVIREDTTGAVLFIGQVLDPLAG